MTTLIKLFSLPLALALFRASAAEDGGRVEVGKPAPDFSLKDQDGKESKLSSFRGKKNVLIAFYPKDFTGG